MPQRDRTERNVGIKRKTEQLQEFVSQSISYRNLVARNSKQEQAVEVDVANRIFVPFLMVKSRNTCQINVEMDESRTEYFFNFSLPFEIHDDQSILNALGMGAPTFPPNTTAEQLLASLNITVASDLRGSPSKRT